MQQIPPELAGRINCLTQQRDSALAQIVIAAGQIAALEAELAALKTPEPEELGDILQFRHLP